MKRTKLSLDEFIALVKSKKELRDIDSSLVKRFILELSAKSCPFEELSFSEQKILLKEVRSKMRRTTGMFGNSDYSKDDSIDSILAKHKSTQERTKIYPELLERLKSLSPKSFLDLGSGLNPLALISLRIPLYAIEIREQDLKIIQREYSNQNIPVQTQLRDLSQGVSNLPPADITLAFKLLDLFGKNKRNIAQDLLSIPSRILIVSFSTCRLSGRRMEHPRRRWFEYILQRNSTKFQIWETNNEIFYFISLSEENSGSS